MSNTSFYVDSLREAGAWLDWRSKYKGGFGWRGSRPLSSVKKLIIHHTVTNPTGNADQEVNLIKKIHIDSNKWGGIGYHFIITTEIINNYAKVAYVGDLASIRAHAPDTKGTFSPARHGNYYYIGISFVGDNTKRAFLPEQIRSAYELCRELIYGEDKRLPLLPDWSAVAGHKEVDPTACPGFISDYRFLKDFRLSDIFTEKEDPKMIKELEEKIIYLQDQAKAKDQVIEDTQKQLTFVRLEDSEFRQGASNEFYKYKNEQDAKYSALKSNYEKLVNQLSQTDDSSMVSQNEQLRMELISVKKDAQFWQDKSNQINIQVPATTVETSSDVTAPIVTVSTGGKTVKDVVDKKGFATSFINFLKTHPLVISKGTAYGSLAFVVADLTANILNLQLPSDWTLPAIIGFVFSGIIVAYGVWLRNRDKLDSIFTKKQVTEVAVTQTNSTESSK